MILKLFIQESSYHDLKAAMVSSMEEFFRVVSVNIMMRKMISMTIASSLFWMFFVSGMALPKTVNLCQPWEHLQLYVSERQFGNVQFFWAWFWFIVFRYEPVLYDYIWHRAHGRNMIWTNVFDVNSPLISFLIWSEYDLDKCFWRKFSS